MDEVLTLISNVGFPIAAYVMLYFSCITAIKENTKAINECVQTINAVRDSIKEDRNV